MSQYDGGWVNSSHTITITGGQMQHPDHLHTKPSYGRLVRIPFYQPDRDGYTKDVTVKQAKAELKRIAKIAREIKKALDE